MPYNYKGDLSKREIVKNLRDMGQDVKRETAQKKTGKKKPEKGRRACQSPQAQS